MIFARIVYFIFGVYEFGLLVYVISSWVPHPLAVLLRLWLAKWYEPFLLRIREAIPVLRLGCTGLDLSPIVLLIAVSLLRSFVVSILVPPF